jgi:DNA polymerase-4
MTNLQRKIIHIDMDAFYAAVEQRDNPLYRNKAIIVGGNPNSRGVVATCSYEARQFGVHSAMPSSHAYRLCPQAIFVKPRFSVYQETSAIIRDIFNSYCDKVEPLSLDEAYLDVTESELFQGSATLLAKQIKAEIRKQTQLIASAGISYNKFLAKLASDYGKPDGLFLITPEQGETFVEQLSIGKFHGIGPATEQKMHQLGIFTGHDLKQVPLEILQQHFGKAAEHYFNIARGIDHRQVNSQQIRKSIGGETTFQQDLDDPQQIIEQLQTLFEQNLAKLQAKNQSAYTLTIKIKYQNFVQITRGKTLSQPIKNNHQARLVIADLLKNTGIGDKKVRLLGVTLSGLENRQHQRLQQMDLFESF